MSLFYLWLGEEYILNFIEAETPTVFARIGGSCCWKALIIFDTSEGEN